MKKEIFESGYYYHIYNRGNNKENIFKEKKNYNYFLQLAQKYLLSIADIYAYCLLPNHFHILLKIKEMEFLPELYKSGKRKIHQPFSNLFNAYSKAINKEYDRTGSLFQEHLHRVRIDSEEYLKQLILYIHFNPEKHKIAEDFSKYSYSSYKSFLVQKSDWIKKSEVFSYFENKDNFMYCHHKKKLKLQMLQEIEKLDD